MKTSRRWREEFCRWSHGSNGSSSKLSTSWRRQYGLLARRSPPEGASMAAQR